MKRALWAILVVLALAIPGTLWAENAGYDGGFYINNDEGTFKLKLNARAQPKYNFVKQGTGVHDPTDPTGTVFLNSKLSTFTMRRAEIRFAATLHDNLTFRVGFKHATNSQNFNTVNVTGATVSYTVIPAFTVTAGMVGLPLDMITDTSSAWYLMVESPISNTQDDGLQRLTLLRSSFGAPDGLGINFSGEISKFFYSLSVVNGNESNYAFNPDTRVALGTRMGVNILDAVPGSQTDFECSAKPKLTFSGGFNYQPETTDGITGATIDYKMTGSAGIALRWGGFSFTTEGYWRRTKVLNPGTAIWARPDMDDIGYYANAGYYVIPQKLEIALQASQIFREGPDNNANQFGGGINWYIIGNNMKLQTNFNWIEDYDDIIGRQNNNIYSLAMMLSAFF